MAAGHAGQVIVGTLAERAVVVLQGRAHLYEGHTAARATFPLRFAHHLGAHSVVITCSAGGLGLAPGSLMFITDHMRAGPGPGLGLRGCPAPYDGAWMRRAQQAAIKHEIDTVRGTIVWVQGPSYETQAEIRYFMERGAQAVGMSTIPEVLEAKRLGMKVLGLALITNAAAGLSPEPLAHQEVLDCARRMRVVLGRLLPEIVRNAPG